MLLHLTKLYLAQISWVPAECLGRALTFRCQECKCWFPYAAGLLCFTLAEEPCKTNANVHSKRWEKTDSKSWNKVPSIKKKWPDNNCSGLHVDFQIYTSSKSLNYVTVLSNWQWRPNNSLKSQPMASTSSSTSSSFTVPSHPSSFLLSLMHTVDFHTPKELAAPQSIHASIQACNSLSPSLATLTLLRLDLCLLPLATLILSPPPQTTANLQPCSQLWCADAHVSITKSKLSSRICAQFGDMHWIRARKTT